MLEKFDPEKKSKKDLQEEITDLIFVAEDGNQLHLDKFKEVACKAITHMAHSFVCCYDKNLRTYCGEDLAKELTEQTRVICRAVDKLKCEDNLKTQLQPPSQDQKQDYKKDVDEVSSSKYSPSESESSTDQDDGARKTSTSSAKKNKPNDKKSSSKRPRQTEPSTPSVSPSPKKPRKSRDKKSSLPSAAKPTPAATLSSSERARSHHKKQQCLVPKSSFHGNDLRHHLQTHVRNNKIALEAVKELLSIVHAGAETRANSQARRGKQPVKGRQRKWCPVPGCNQVVLDMAHHLENPTLHGLAQDSKVHIHYLTMATPYTGLEELEDQLIPPPQPAIVKVLPTHNSLPVFAAFTLVCLSRQQDTSSATISAAATASTLSAAASPTAFFGSCTAPRAAPSNPPSSTAAVPSPSASATVANAEATIASEDNSEAESDHQSQ